MDGRRTEDRREGPEFSGLPVTPVDASGGPVDRDPVGVYDEPASYRSSAPATRARSGLWLVVFLALVALLLVWLF